MAAKAFALAAAAAAKKPSVSEAGKYPHHYTLHGDGVVVLRETDTDLFHELHSVWVHRAGRVHEPDQVGTLLLALHGDHSGQFTYLHPKRGGDPRCYFQTELAAVESLLNFHIVGRHIGHKPKG
jgi:hypothetical protein